MIDKKNPRISIHQLNKSLGNAANTRTRSLQKGLVTPTSVIVGANRPLSIKNISKIFVVQSAATGDGIYNCFESVLNSGRWDDTGGNSKFYPKDVNVEVLNLKENWPTATYTPALGLYDLIQAWQMTDDRGTKRWIGIPLTNSTRWVRATEDAPATGIPGTTITCNLLLNNGAEAIDGHLGYEIEVGGQLCGPVSDWNEVVPRIESGDWLMASCENGAWSFVTQFQASEDCGCYTEPE